MKTWTIASLALLLSLALAAEAIARPRPAGRSKPFRANKTFGLGIMLGNPTGLSGKYYLGVDTALDFGLGVSGHHRRRYASGLHLHADFLWHPVVVAQTDPFWLPLYFGIGARLLLDDHRDDRHDHIGVRAPLGLSMDFNNVPLDIFFELALVVDFINTHGHHGYVDLNAAIGIRYYF